MKTKGQNKISKNSDQPSDSPSIVPFVFVLGAGVAFLYTAFQSGSAKFNSREESVARSMAPNTLDQYTIVGGDNDDAINPASTQTLNVDDDNHDFFLILDKDENGVVSHHEFWLSYRQLGHVESPQVLWTTMDSNDDGILTSEEVEAAYRHLEGSQKKRTLTQTSGTAGIDLFTKLDVNRDGKLSRTEFSELNGGQMNEELEKLWNQDNKDDDAFVSYEEFSGPKPGNEADSSQISFQIFESMDADGDRTLSYTEFMDAQSSNLAAQELWDDADQDQSGLVTLAEFSDHFDRMQTMDGVTDNGRSGEGFAKSTNSNGLMVEDTFELFDDNGDGTLSRMEWMSAVDASGPEVDDLWRQADKDHSDSLSLDEFEKWMQNKMLPSTSRAKNSRLTDLRGGFGFSKNEKQIINSPVDQAEKLPDFPDKTESMHDKVSGVVQSIFSQIDINLDGRISEDEFMTAHGDNHESRTTWALGDRNGDGFVERSELAITVREELSGENPTFQEKQHQYKKGISYSNDSPQAGALPTGSKSFFELDTNNDAVISATEFYEVESGNSDAFLRWEKLDADSDNVLSAIEFQKYDLA